MEHTEAWVFSSFDRRRYSQYMAQISLPTYAYRARPGLIITNENKRIKEPQQGTDS